MRLKHIFSFLWELHCFLLIQSNHQLLNLVSFIYTREIALMIQLGRVLVGFGWLGWVTYQLPISSSLGLDQCSCNQCGHQVTERYNLKQHTKFQAISYFYEKAVGLYKMMPIRDSFQLLFIVNLKIFSKKCNCLPRKVLDSVA